MKNWFKIGITENRNKLDNIYFQKIQSHLISNQKIIAFSKVWLLGSFVYSMVNYERFNKALKQDKLNSFIDKTSFDTNMDNIEVYYVEYSKSNINYLVTIIDHYELLIPEKILDVIEINKMEIQENYELIYESE